MKAAPEKYRLINHPVLGTNSGDGNKGMFIIPHPKIEKYFLQCVISDGAGWEHVSVTIQSTIRKVERCPTWEEMCIVKDIFFEPEETVMQLHPPKSQYVSTHPYCLHLWRPLGIALPLPDPRMVGKVGDNVQK